MRLKCLKSLAGVMMVCAGSAWAQTSRISQTVDNSKRTVLTGQMHPKAKAAYDQGRVTPALELTYVTLTLAPTASQQADLEKLLIAQQTKGSPNYQKWLTPEEYAQR